MQQSVGEQFYQPDERYSGEFYQPKTSVRMVTQHLVYDAFCATVYHWTAKWTIAAAYRFYP